MNPSHTLSLVAHHRARSGEWLIKKLMEDFQVIIGFIQETEATSHGNVTADRRINLLRSSKRVFRNIDKFKGNMTDLDFIMNDMQVQLQVHVCEAVKTGPIFPQTIAAPGPLSFANNPLPSKFRDYQMPDKFSNADVGVTIFQNHIPQELRPPQVQPSNKHPLHLHTRPTSQSGQSGQQLFSYGAVGQPVPRRASLATTTLVSPTESSPPQQRFALEESPVSPWNKRPHAFSHGSTLTANTEASDEEEAKTDCQTPTPYRPIQRLLQDVTQRCRSSDSVPSNDILAKLEELQSEVVETRLGLKVARKEHEALRHAYAELSERKS